MHEGKMESMSFSSAFTPEFAMKSDIGCLHQRCHPNQIWLGSVLCELLMKVRLLYAKNKFNLKFCLALLQRNTHT